MVRASGQSDMDSGVYSSRMRYALLTGVGRPGQVGEAVAARLAADGYSLILVDRTAEAVQARAEDLRTSGKSAKAYSADLSSEAEVADLFSAIRREHGDRLAAFVHL